MEGDRGQILVAGHMDGVIGNRDTVHGLQLRQRCCVVDQQHFEAASG